MFKELALAFWECWLFIAWLIGTFVLAAGIGKSLKYLLIEYLKEDLQRKKERNLKR